MKKILVLILLSGTLLCVSFTQISAHLFEKTRFITAFLGAYPTWKQAYGDLRKKWHKIEYIDSLEDIHPELETFIRNRLQDQQYTQAATIPLKKAPIEGTMHAYADYALIFSEEFSYRMHDLVKKHEADFLSPDELIRFQDFIVSLDHQMAHIHHKHTASAIVARTAIPFITECLSLPTTAFFSQKSTDTYALYLLASIVIKRNINSLLSLLHTRSQEQIAEEWAITKNNSFQNKMHLEGFIQFRKNQVRSLVRELTEEFKKKGFSRSKLFNVLVYLFHEQELDSALLYKNFALQPAKWPLRLLELQHNPAYPFSLDIAKQAKRSIRKD